MSRAAQSPKTYTIKQLRSARAWCTAAIKDCEANDRIDALDAIDFAKRHLRNARRAIRQTLPKAVQ